MCQATPTAARLPFVSSVAFEPARIDAAAVYCSDGRFGAAFDDFLHRGLSLAKVDRLAVPGGPATLAGVSGQGIVDELKFLVDAHELRRVVLIQHAGCAFYAGRLGVGEASAEQLQLADLARAAYTVRQALGDLAIDGFFARVDANAITFDRVELR